MNFDDAIPRCRGIAADTPTGSIEGILFSLSAAQTAGCAQDHFPLFPVTLKRAAFFLLSRFGRAIMFIAEQLSGTSRVFL